MSSLGQLKLAVFVLLIVLAVTERKEAQWIKMQRTACLVLSRYHSTLHQDVVQSIVMSLPPSDRDRYKSKAFAVAVQICERSITQSQVQEFFVQNNNFELSLYLHSLDEMNYSSITSNLDTTAEQDEIIQWTKKFDQQNNINRGPAGRQNSEVEDSL